MDLIPAVWSDLKNCSFSLSVGGTVGPGTLFGVPRTEAGFFSFLGAVKSISTILAGSTCKITQINNT